MEGWHSPRQQPCKAQLQLVRRQLVAPKITRMPADPASRPPKQCFSADLAPDEGVEDHGRDLLLGIRLRILPVAVQLQDRGGAGAAGG